jgi:hypothetical protein
MLLLNLILLIAVTFSTPTGDCAHYDSRRINILQGSDFHLIATGMGLLVA